MPSSFAALPEPPCEVRAFGHLPEWGRAPLPLIEAGAEAARRGGGDVFRLRLGLPAVVGFSPAWNRRLLSDLDTFVSAGSFSRVVPYLSGGVILSDAPEHAGRRGVLNPGFGRRAVLALEERVRRAVPAVPEGPFDALAWADGAVLRALNAAYFSGEADERLLHAFLAPLRRPFPVPAVPRPLLFRRMDGELRRLMDLRAWEGGRNDLLAFLAGVPDGLLEARVSLAAAHDTTTHALAYALWQLALHPEWHGAEGHPWVLKEVLRLWPPGWMGSRRLARDVDWQGVPLPRGAVALYSPYLTGRDAALWPEPLEFRPGRWATPPPAWAYLPFGGGERTCLGLHLAQSIILTVLEDLPPLRAHWGDARARPGITLGPAGPLVVQRRAQVSTAVP